MVAIVTGLRLGLVRDSAMLLGSQGQLGTALLGQGGNRVTVNAANGNLIVQTQDEMLIGRGPDEIVGNTYNSQTASGPAWQESFLRRVVLSGTLNSATSTVTRYASDGSDIVYAYATSGIYQGSYVANEAGGAYDVLTYAEDAGATNKRWVWTEGKTRLVEEYDYALGRLKSTKDADGNALTYRYNTYGQMDRITTANGNSTREFTDFTYLSTTSSQITKAMTTYLDTDGVTVSTRTRIICEYDSYNRLHKVTIDLSPKGSAISDNNTFVTVYDYVDTTSNRIATITEKDGSGLQSAQLDITYSGTQVASLVQTSATGQTEKTLFRYGSGWTTVTDPQGNSTTLVYDGSNRLVQLISPPAITDGPSQLRAFTYDSNGNLLSNILLPGNSVSDPNFSNITTMWNDLTISPSVATTQSIERDGGVMVYRRATNGTAASGTVMSLGQGTALSSYTAVTPGQTVQFSAYTATSGAGSVRLNAVWRNWSGDALSPLTTITGTRDGSLLTAGPASGNFVSGSATVPAGAAYVELMVDATADGTAALVVAIARPTLVILGTSQAPGFTYTYDAVSGNRLSETDALGHQTLYTYDVNNQMLTRTVDALGAAPQTTRYVYDGESHLTYVISPLGEVTRYVYNTYGQQTNIIQFSSADLYVTSTNPSDTTMYGWATATARAETAFHRTDMVYDFRGNLSTSTAYGTTNPDGSGDATTAITTTYVYDLSGQLYSRQVSGMTGSEFYLYDGLGRVTSVKTFNGKETTTVYANTGNGLTATVSMLNGRTEVSTYDQAGELVSYRIYGAGIDATTYYYYDSNGNRVRTVDPTGLSSYAVYDERNRKVADVAADGSVTTYVYNTYDQLVSTIAYGTRLTTAQLATLNTATATQVAALATSIMLSQVTPTTAASDRWSWNVYDAEGRLVQGIDALGFVTAYTYDNADRLIKTTAYATAVSVTSLQTTAPTSPVTVTASSTNDRTIRRFYDKDGQLIAVLDAEGYLTQTVYDAFGQKVQTLASATVTGSSYRASGTLAQLKASITASNDDIANWFYYDNAGRLLASVDGEGFITRYANYNAAGYAQTVTRGGNAITVTTTTTSGTLPATTGAVEVTTYTYDQYGHILTSAVTPTGGPVETTTYVYDDVYRLTSQTVASTPSTTGRTANVMYDAGGRKIKEMSGIGSGALAAAGTDSVAIAKAWNDYATTYSYDAAGRLIAQTDPKGVITGTGTLAASGNKTVFYYNVDGQLSYKVDGTGGVVRYLYDAFGEVSDVRAYANKIATGGLTGGLDTALTTLPTADDNLDSHTVTNYDLAGHVDDTTVTVINKTGNATDTETNSFDYNAFGDLTSKLDFFYKSSSGTQSWIKTTQTYSRRGLLMSSTADSGTSHLNLLTGYSYDAFGQVISVTDPNGNVTGYDYDPLAHKVTVTDPNNATSSTVHDAFGRITSTIDRNNKTTSYAYDLFGRKVTVTDRNLNATQTSYNAYGEVVSVLDGSNTSTSKTYDADGRVISETDGNNKVTRYVYDNAGQVAFVIDRVGSVTGYGYDAEGRVIQATKYAVFYTASGIKYLSDMTTWVGTGSNAVGSLLTKTTYDGMGHVQTVTDANNVVTTYTYDPSGRKLKEVVDSGDATHLNLTTTWEYNGDRIVTVKSPEVRAITYTYDNVGRLLSEVVDPGTGHLILTTTYTYDADGNLTIEKDPELKEARQLYDGNNNVTWQVDPNGNVTAYTYDLEGRLTGTTLYATQYTGPAGLLNGTTLSAMSTTGAIIARRTYDAEGRQTYNIDAMGLVTGYKYDDDNRVIQVTRYATLYTTGGTPNVAVLDAMATTSGLVTRTMYDAGGRVTYSIDPTGAVTAYAYDGEGRTIQVTQYAALYPSYAALSGPPNATTLSGLASLANDIATRTVYDALGRVIYSLDALGAVTGYKYDAEGRVIQGLRYSTLYPSYSALTGAPSLTTLNGLSTGGSLITRTVYDAAGRVTYSLNPLGAVTGYKYDGDGRVTQVTQYFALYPSYASLSGAPSLTTLNGLNNATRDLISRTVYDKAGRVIYGIDETGAVTGYKYDGDGRVTQTTRYAALYTATGTPNLTTLNSMTITAADVYTRTVYDAGGRVAYSIDAAGIVTDYQYDSNNNATRTIRYYTPFANLGPQTTGTMSNWLSTGAPVPNSDLRSYAFYDADGHPTWSVSAVNDTTTTGSVTANSYDNFGRLVKSVRYATELTVGAGATPTLANLQALATTSSDLWTRFVYDLDSRVTYSIGSAPGSAETIDDAVTATTYDTFGRVIQSVQYLNRYAPADVPNLDYMVNTWAANNGGVNGGASDLVTRSAYDKDGRLTWTVDATGAIINYLYDNFDRVQTETRYAVYYGGAAGVLNTTTLTGLSTTDSRATTYGYNGDSTIASATDPANRRTDYIYDTLGHLTQSDIYMTATPAVKLTTRQVFNNKGQEAYLIDAAGSVTFYSDYDAWGHAIQTIQYYNAWTVGGTADMTTMAGWVGTSASSTNDRVTRSFYDDDRLAYSIDGYGAVTRYLYNFQGLVASTVQYATRYTTPGVLNAAPSVTVDAAKDHTTSYTYDNDGALTEMADPAMIKTINQYDAFGRKTRTDVASNITADTSRTNWDYNTSGLVTQTAAYNSGAVAVTTSTYNALGWLINSVDGNTYTTVYDYDKDGRLTSTTAPTGIASTDHAVTTNAYNVFGELAKVTDPNNNVNTNDTNNRSCYFYYDGLGRQKWAIDAEGYSTETTYDLTGQVASVTRYSNQVIPVGVTLVPPAVTPDPTKDNTTRFVYDGDGRLKSTTTDGTTGSTLYTYDALGNRLTMVNALGAEIKYSYDQSGHLTRQETPAGTLPDSTAIAPATRTDYTYDIFGNRSTMVESKLVGTVATALRTTTYAYDKNNRLTDQSGDAVTKVVVSDSGVVTTTPGVTPSQHFDYDGRGNQVAVTDANGNKTVTFYDDQNRREFQVDALGYVTQWIYDDNDNLTSQTVYETVVALPTAPYTTPPTPLGNYRRTSYTYDRANRLLTTTIEGVQTGAWSGSAWTLNSATDVTTSNVYDANGNLIKVTGANGNATYNYYDKLGRKTFQIDTLNYATRYDYDAEGNVTKQTQFAKVWTPPSGQSGPPLGGVRPSDPTADIKDRITDFTYDHHGWRTSETRENMDYYVFDTTTGLNTVVRGNAGGTSSVTINFDYNDMGQIVRKTEATGDYTTYAYDKLGRMGKVTTGNVTAPPNGSNEPAPTANVMTTLTTYDALGNISQTIAGYGTTSTETTTYTYGEGGRLQSKKQEETNFTLYYSYDANGQTTLESWQRLKADGTTILREANLTRYDARGQVIGNAKATRTSDTADWTLNATSRTDTFYNAYGEVIARGTNTNSSGTSIAGVIANAEEFADYDAAGRVWRTNLDGGVVTVYGYDKNGNTTLQMVSQGTTSLLKNGTTAVADLSAALLLTGTTRTCNLFDARNQLIDVKKPASANADGTITSASQLSGQRMSFGIAREAYNPAGGGSSEDFVSVVTVSLSDLWLATDFGSAPLTVKVTGYDAGLHSNTTTSKNFSAGETVCTLNSLGYSTNIQLTVAVYQGTTLLASTVSSIGQAASDTVQYGSRLDVAEVAPSATNLTMYVRASGTNDNYTQLSGTRRSENSLSINTFSFDTQKAPFNGAAGTWDVKYVATDAGGKIVDVRSATVTLTGSYPAVPAVTNFTSIQPFSATVVAGTNPAQWTLGTISAAGYVTTSHQGYNAFGDLTSQTDAYNQTATLEYDVMGHVVKKTAPGVNTVRDDAGGHVVVDTTYTPIDEYYYDRSGRLIAHKDPNGHGDLSVTSDDYMTTQLLLAGTGYGDSTAQVVKQYNPTSGITTNTYDIFGNLYTQSDTLGLIASYTYDAANRVKTVAHATRAAGSETNDYTDNTSGVTQLVDTYTYDGLGQRTKHSNNVQSGAETTDYDLLGRVSRTVTVAGQSTDYVYSWQAQSATGRVIAGQAGVGYWTKIATTVSRNAYTRIDAFGKLVKNIDQGGHASWFSYNQAGQLTVQWDNDHTATGQRMEYTYTTTGQIASITDARKNTKALYVYDNNGNRTQEIYYNTSTYEVSENSVVTYDALNRVTEYNDSKADINYAYDGNSNRREIRSTYHWNGHSEDYWYSYDKMDRFTITKGTKVHVGSYDVVQTGTTGISISYDVRGQRINATTYGDDGHSEDYAYTTDGYLKTVTIGGYVSVARKTDVLGRMVYYAEFEAGSTNTATTRNITYDTDGRVTDEYGSNRVRDANGTTFTTYDTTVHNVYKIGTVDQGVLVSSTSTQTEHGNPSNSKTNREDYTYVWWAGAKTDTVKLYVDNATTATSTSTYVYDVNGNITEVDDSGNTRRQAYTMDIFGQVVHREEQIYDTLHGYWKTNVWRDFLYFNGRGIGDFGDDALPSEIDYAQQLSNDRGGIVPTGPLTPSDLLTGDFDTSYQPYNPMTVGQAGSSYTASAGDTLQSIALAVWGDASLWYVLAEANGMNAGATLLSGQIVRIPNKVNNVHNNSGTFKPYDVNDAMGNTSPTEPQPPAPKRQGCGAMGDVLALIVSTAVSFLVPGGGIIGGAISAALSDIAYQAVEIAVGNQSKFNWKELGASALAGGITGGLSKYAEVTVKFAGTASKIATAMARQAINNVVRQGVNMAFGLQKSFDWTGLAVSAASAGMMQGFSQATGIKTGLTINPSTGNVVNIASKLNFTETVLVGAADVLSKAVTKTLISHQSFGKSIMEYLPETVGATIGNAAGQYLAGTNAGHAVSNWFERGIGTVKGQVNRAFGGGNMGARRDGGGVTSASWRDSPLLNTHYFDQDIEKYSNGLNDLKFETSGEDTSSYHAQTDPRDRKRYKWAGSNFEANVYDTGKGSTAFTPNVTYSAFVTKNGGKSGTALWYDETSRAWYTKDYLAPESNDKNIDYYMVTTLNSVDGKGGGVAAVGNNGAWGGTISWDVAEADAVADFWRAAPSNFLLAHPGSYYSDDPRDKIALSSEQYFTINGKVMAYDPLQLDFSTDNGYTYKGDVYHLNEDENGSHIENIGRIRTRTDGQFESNEEWQRNWRDWGFRAGIDEKGNSSLTVAGVFLYDDAKDWAHADQDTAERYFDLGNNFGDAALALTAFGQKNTYDPYEVKPQTRSLRLSKTPAAETTAPNVWKLGPGPRGEAIEQAFGHNLPGSFPVIDRWENGIATSIKSIDLDGASYLTGNGLKNTLTGYVDKVSAYSGTGVKGWGGLIIKDSQISSRGLDLVIPHSGTAAQQQVISDIVKYGASRPNPVNVNVIVYP